MQNRKLFNRLKLSCCPLSNYDFVCLNEVGVNLSEILQGSNIYIIAQRPVLTFENLFIDNSTGRKPLLKFQIKQKGNKSLLTCSFPFRQKAMQNSSAKKLAIHFDLDYEYADINQKNPPFSHLRSFMLYEVGEEIGSWFSPERFLFSCWNEHLKADIDGDIADFLKYRVHYIGKATEQHIIKRLTNHEHLQDILSKEYPFSYGSLPTDEITLLFFEFDDNIHLQMFGTDNPISDEIFKQLASGTLPIIPEKDIYLDAEKALINALRPKHNKVFYKNYPSGKNGLEQYSLETNTYSFWDPITLVYESGEISGRNSFFDADTLFVNKSEPLKVVKTK